MPKSCSEVPWAGGGVDMQRAWFSYCFSLIGFYIFTTFRGRTCRKSTLDFNPSSAKWTVTCGKMETPMPILQTSWTVT